MIRMSHAFFEHVRGKAVAQRVRPAAPPSLVIHGSRPSNSGEEPLRAAVRLPNLPKHLENRLGQRQNPLLVPLADDTQSHRVGGDCRDG